MSYQTRNTRLLEYMKQHQLPMLVLNPSPSFVYLTGLHFHIMERPTLLWISDTGKKALITAELERENAKKSAVPLEVFCYSDDPSSWRKTFQAAADYMGPIHNAIGIEPNHIRFLELDLLQQVTAGNKLISGEKALTALRIRKDPDELELIQKAVDIAETAFTNFIKQIVPGMSERQAVGELSIQLLKAGSESKFAFTPIIASGPNSADPHASPGDRVFQPGDLIVVDWGAVYQGYASDLTRMIAITPIADELRNIHQAVKKANQTARESLRAGLTCGAMDQIARDCISQAGYGPYFTHRLGHGIGMEVHEPPFLFGANTQPLETGMVITIEPGIYLPGKGGVRIEDDAVITPDGSKTLSSLNRDLIEIQLP